MDSIITLATVLLGGTAVWLWRLGKAQMMNFFLRTSLSYPYVIALPRSKIMRLGKWYERKLEPLSYLISDLIFDLIFNKFMLCMICILPILAIAGFLYSSVSLLHLYLAGGSIPPVDFAFFIVINLVSIILGAISWVTFVMVMDYISINTYSRKDHSIKYRDFRFRYGRIYTGYAFLPKKVYKDDSKNVSIELNQGPSIEQLTASQIIAIGDSQDGKPVTVQIQREDNGDQYIEVELLAAGVTIKGEIKQRQKVNVSILHYHWNCYFGTSGNQEISLILRLVNPADIIELGVIEHNVLVARLDHMTQHQVWLIASILTIISGVLGVIQVLSKMGVGL